MEIKETIDELLNYHPLKDIIKYVGYLESMDLDSLYEEERIFNELKKKTIR